MNENMAAKLSSLPCFEASWCHILSRFLFILPCMWGATPRLHSKPQRKQKDYSFDVSSRLFWCGIKCKILLKIMVVVVARPSLRFGALDFGDLFYVFVGAREQGKSPKVLPKCSRECSQKSGCSRGCSRECSRGCSSCCSVQWEDPQDHSRSREHPDFWEHSREHSGALSEISLFSAPHPEDQ